MLSRIGAEGLLSGVLVLGALAAPSAGEETPVAPLTDGRAGKIHFASRRRPAISAGSAMVIAHGSSGVDARETAWADRLTAPGMATFVVDSFTPRNVRETATDQGRLPTAANVADALAALRLLATHPRIDPERIGVTRRSG
jgi:dienelactone hydrolase